MKSEDISRRSFLKRALALSAATAIPSFWIPSKAGAMPGVPFVSANEKVNIAFIYVLCSVVIGLIAVFAGEEIIRRL